MRRTLVRTWAPSLRSLRRMVWTDVGHCRERHPQLISPTASLVLFNGPLTCLTAAWTTWQEGNQGTCEPDTQRCDRVRHVALRAQRQHLWVGNRREGQIAGLARDGKVLRGEASPFRRPGTRKPRCKDLRDGESRAIRDLHSVRGQPPA